MTAFVVLAAIAANVVNGLVSERTGTVYPARARMEILKVGAGFRRRPDFDQYQLPCDILDLGQVYDLYHVDEL